MCPAFTNPAFSIAHSHQPLIVLRNLVAGFTNNLTLTEARSKLRNKQRIHGTIVGSDNFDAGGTYSFVEGGLSPNGKWDNQYLGGTGSASGVRLNSAIGNNVMWEKPQVSTAEFETHATFNLFIESQFSDFDVTIDMKTISQLRQNFPPNAWETAWILFRYTDNWHHYYLVLKTSGIELGRKDYATQIEQQIFLVTNGSPTVSLGNWQNLRIRAVKNRFTVWVDGVFAFDFLDDGSVGYDTNTGGLPAPPSAAMYNGYIGLYTEDAEVEFNNFTVAEVNLLSLSDVISKVEGKTRSLAAQNITLSDTRTRLRNKIRLRSDSITLTHTSTVRSRLLSRLRSDSLTLSDSGRIRLKNLVRLRTDIITITHTSTNRLKNLVRLRTDSLTLSHISTAALRMLIQLRTDSLTFVHTSTPTMLRNRIRGFTNSLAFTESIVNVINLIRGLAAQNLAFADTVVYDITAKVKGFINSLGGLSDTSSRLLGKNRALDSETTTITLSDSFARTLVLKLRTFSESLGLSDTTSKTRGKEVNTPTDSISFADSSEMSRNFWRILSDSIVLSENIQTLSSRIRAITGAVSFSDALTRLVNKNRSISESLSFTDNGFSRFVEWMKVVTAASLSFASINDRLTARIRTLHNLNIQFDSDVTFGGALVRAISHVLGLEDGTITRLKAINRESSDDITLEQPEVSRLRQKITGFDDSLTFDEYLVDQLKLKLKTISDSIGLSMSGYDTLRTKLVTLSDSISLTDLVNRLKGLKIKTISESIGPFNIASIITAKGIGRSISSSLSLFAENVTHTKLLRVRALASQNLGLSHINSRIRNKIKSTSTQNLNLSESLQRQRYKLKSFSENLSISETIDAAREIMTRGFTSVLSFDSVTISKSIPARVKDFTNNLVLTSTAVKDIVSRGVVEPIISTLGYKARRPELYVSVNPITLYRRIVEKDAHPLIQKKDLDIDKPVKHPDIPGSTPEIKAENKMDVDVKTKLNRGKKIGRLF